MPTKPVYLVNEGRSVWFSGPVVIDGVFHRVAEKFVSCNPSLNGHAWNTTEPKRICFHCFPTEEDRAPLVEEIESRAQLALFKD